MKINTDASLQENIIFLCGKRRKDDKFWGMSWGWSPRDILRNLLSFLSFPHKNVILFKVSRTRICILVLKTLEKIKFLSRKLRKDDKFLRMPLRLHPQDIPQNSSSFLRFPHKNIIFSCSVPNRNGFRVWHSGISVQILTW